MLPTTLEGNARGQHRFIRLVPQVRAKKACSMAQNVDIIM